MAKSAQGFPISPGSGASLSLFQLANTRLRETVIIADSDNGGEALHVELPAHDSPDRGSPIKIGGKASSTAPTAVGALDRVDAWLTPQGHLRVVTSNEPSVVYDGGRQPVNSASGTGLALNNTSATIIAALAGVKTKVLAVYVQSVAFTTTGSIGLAGSGTTAYFAQCTAANQNFYIYAGPVRQYATNANTALSLTFTGNATFNWTVVYYQAP